MSERINFLYKKFNRTPSTSTDISSNQLETFDVSGRHIIYNDEIYTDDIPSILPTFNITFSYNSSTSVDKNDGSLTTINMNGIDNSTLVSNNGLTEDIWQAFRDNKISSVLKSSTNISIIKINNLVIDYVTDTNSIINSPSYYHSILEDSIPNTIKNQIYDVIIKGKNSSNQIITLLNDTIGDWIIQPECGIIQFLDQSASLVDNSNNFYNLFDITSNLSSTALFNKIKTPIVTFYKYVGLKGIGLKRTSNISFNLPSTYGTNGEYMSTDGSGNLLFQSGSTPWTTSGNNIYYNTGNVGIGVINPGYKLEVNGTGHFSSTLTSSDDRLKHNKIILTNALDDIRQLVPKKYFKTLEMYDGSHNFLLDLSNNPIDLSGNIVEHTTEIGLIAQEVKLINNLAFCVKDESIDKPMSINYNDILVHVISALKELDTLHTNTVTELNNEKSKVNQLETRLLTLQSQMNNLINRVQTLETI
jgi:hypothetical protein